MPTSVRPRNQLRKPNSAAAASTENMPSQETTIPPPMSFARVSGVVIDTKLAPNRITMTFSATTAMPNEATNTVKNEPSSRWIGRYIQRSSSTPKVTPAAAAAAAAIHHGRCSRSAR